MKAFILNLLLIFLALPLFAQAEINVRKYGAKGDGIADDTKAIQRAINASSPLTRSIIYFPAGIYNIASYTSTPVYFTNYSLLLHSNLDIKGDGDKTIILVGSHIFDKEDTSANAHLFLGKNTSNISFSNLVIDMNGSNNLVPSKTVTKNHSAIFTSYGKNYYIHDITIKNCSGTNMINIMSKGSNLIIENCKFLNGGNYVGTPIPNKNQYDYSFIYSEWDSTFVKNNIIKQQNVDISLSNYTGGIELHGNNSSASGNLIEGCWPGIFITSSNAGVLKNARVNNNRFINCVTGVSFWLIQPMENISIDSNEIKLTHSRSSKLNLCAGILMPNGNAKEYSMRLANAAPLTNLEISGNNITSDAMKNLSAGMVLHSIQNSLIQNNIISGMNYGGIVLSASKWGTDSLNVTNNTFTDFRPNNDKNAVAGYIVVTDTYSSGVKDAPGYKEVLFSGNIFIRNKLKSAEIAHGEGKFLGGFIALPSNMVDGIKFNNNKFSDSSEKILVVRTN